MVMTSFLDAFDDESSDPDGLRWYQREAFDQIRSRWERAQTLLLVLATGLGKTQVFSAVAKHAEGPVLVLAHRDELVTQARARLEQMTGESVEIEQRDWVASDRARLVVGSIQSFNQARLERLGKDRFAYVVMDEGHHVLAKTYRRAFEWFNAKKLLVTATPDRGDEKALGQIVDEVAYCMDISDGIDAGYLVPVLGQQVHVEEVKLDEVAVTGGDFVQGQLDEAMLKAVKPMVHETLRLQPGRQAIGFFPGVKSAEAAMYEFNARIPGSACFVSGTTEVYERRQLVRDFKAGKFLYLCNCDVATEGFDAPATAVVINGAPTKSRAKYAQRAGRGTRPLAGLVDHVDGKEGAATRRRLISLSKKPNMTLLDFVGSSGKHSLVSPEDLLGGNYEEADIEAAKKKRKLDKSEDPRELLSQAKRAREMAAAAAIRAQIKAVASPYDPFRVFGMSITEEQRYSDRFGGKPITEGQLVALQSLGVPDQELRGMSKRAASTLLDRFNERRKKGLCTYKQLRTLQKHGIFEQDITFERANAAITYMANKSWKPEPKTLREILSHKREPGED